VELQDRATKRDYIAREVFGDEKALWWERAVTTWPDYARYQTKTERQIPVFVLDPATPAEWTAPFRLPCCGEASSIRMTS
jgi:hypothetical protein